MQTLEKYYSISAGDEISWTNTKEMNTLENWKKVTEEDIIGMIKKLPYNSVEIKKRGSKGLNWWYLIFVDSSYIIALIIEKDHGMKIQLNCLIGLNIFF